nr:LOW QUALITY PROTEIN: olfactory receptor 5K3-like [Microcebus murinus]
MLVLGSDCKIILKSSLLHVPLVEKLSSVKVVLGGKNSSHGFTDHPELSPCLVVFSAILWVITMVVIGWVVLIYAESLRRTECTSFWATWLWMDSWCSCAITPMLENFYSDRAFPLMGCMAQFTCLPCRNADCFFWRNGRMTFIVAICSPLRYAITKMSRKLCFRCVPGAYIAGNLHSMIHVGFLFRLTFCGSHQINHFFCDILPLYRLSCVDPYINELMILIFSGSVQIFTITIVLISYLCILFTIFTMKSKAGRSKALSTCASHFLSVSIFYGSLLFMYIRPNSFKEGDKDIPVAIFYTLVIPLLNPFIYSLRNKEVINVVKRIMTKISFCNILKQVSSPFEN